MCACSVNSFSTNESSCNITFTFESVGRVVATPRFNPLSYSKLRSQPIVVVWLHMFSCVLLTVDTHTHTLIGITPSCYFRDAVDWGCSIYITVCAFAKSRSTSSFDSPRVQCTCTCEHVQHMAERGQVERTRPAPERNKPQNDRVFLPKRVSTLHPTPIFHVFVLLRLLGLIDACSS